MFIHIESLIFFGILATLSALGMRYYYLQKINDYYKMYEEKNEMCIALSKELSEYKKEKILQEIQK